MKKMVEMSELIDRKTASRLLKISLRTLDRYRQKGMLSTHIINNKILLKKEDINELIDRHSRQGISEYLSIDIDRDRVVSAVDRKGISEDKNTRRKGKNNKEQDIGDLDDLGNEWNKAGDSGIAKGHEHDFDLIEYYKKLYGELLQEAHEMQSKLEGASYRVGQLEAQLKYSVPLLEHKKETLKLLKEKGTLEDSLEILKQQFQKAKFLVFNERFNKRVYLGLVLILILLQPLWIYLSMR